MDGIQMIQGEDGVFREYDNTNDITIHFESKEDKERFFKENSWIDVDYELPPVDQDGESEYLLLSFANYSIPTVGRYSEDKDGGGNFYAGDDDIPLIKYDLYVNAWRFLPKSMEE